MFQIAGGGRGLGIWDGERDGGMVGVSVARW